MSLFILGFVLIFVGLWLSIHQHRDAYRDTWAVLLMVSGVVLIVVRIIIHLWRQL